MKRPTVIQVILALIAFALTGFVWAADPPELVNYQGVLRNSMDAPLDGSFAMTFRFFDALTEGNEILVDTHGAVTVSEGLFNVEVGGGTITDGSGPGIFTTLSAVFAQHASLYLEIQVNGETLSPRTLVAAAGYALNARRVRGVEIVSDGPLTFWVDGSAGGCGGDGCSDSNDGLSLATAKPTIQGAMDAIPTVLNGDVTVNVQPGTYAECVRVPLRTRRGGLHSVKLVGDEAGYPNPSVIIDGTSVPPGACGPVYSGVFIYDTLVEASGFTIRNFDTMGEDGAGVQAGMSTYVTVSKCLIENNDVGIFATRGAGVKILDSRVENNDLGLRTKQHADIDVEAETVINNGASADTWGHIHWPDGDPTTCTISGDLNNCFLYSLIENWCHCTTNTATCSGQCCACP